MSLVYNNAQDVLVWLGPSNNDSDSAFELMNLDPPSKAILQHQEQGLRDLFWRSYWTCVWIIQELCKASHATVLCGMQAVSWAVLSDMLELLSKVEPEMPPSVQHILSLKDFRKRESQRTRGFLLDLIIDNRRSKSTDPRDKIYAILSLAADGVDLFPMPNYKLDPNTVFLKTTISILKRYPKNISWILIAHRTNRPPKDWPSWAPHWGTIQEYVPLWTLSEIRESHKRLEDSNQTPLPRYHTLEISVVILDKIGGLFSTFSETGDRPVQLYNEVSLWFEIFGERTGIARKVFWRDLYNPIAGNQPCPQYQVDKPKFSNLFVGGYSAIPAYALYLCCSSSEASTWARANGSIILQGNSLSGRMETVRRAGNPTKSIINRKDKKLALEQASKRLKDGISEAKQMGMKLVITSGGDVAKVYRDAQQNDRKCRIVGCDVLIILRPRAGPDGGFTFVGEVAYYRPTMKPTSEEILRVILH